MSGVSITFTPEIIANAKARGVELTRDEIESIDTSLNAFITVEDGKLKFTSSSFLDISEAVESMSARFGNLIEKPATSPMAAPDLPANATATDRAMAKVQAERARRSGDAAAVAAAGNPWAVGESFSRTNQAVITLKDPALAARLRNEANAQ